ncbi:uncharacterized protein RCC_05870 [Ramularia collo-cygni]|uniref:Uncharacterized protein n=1 Tax=Ramularia collo-cygni TaxID=112498 RepID=A0A2D3VH15_9PEZI|nr:uncharacterized protein RCC_05870 [Ramularia collo-cygni]CZT20013.1 uncharacterized protein RCC_05870 [Ramularia collo-cygni]
MSTAVAAPTSTLPAHFTPQSIAPTSVPMTASSPPSNGEPAPRRPRSNATPEGAVGIGRERRSPENKSSPASGTGSISNSNSNTHSLNIHRSGGAPPMVKVKREPGSPVMPSSRPRPKRLDLSSSMSNSRGGPHTGRPSAPLTSRESAGLAIQDVGLACLSPGFATSNPGMREQLQRSLDVRDQQRLIIEARQKGTKPGSSSLENDGPRTQDTTLFGVPTGGRTPLTSRRKGPPTALSISAPSAAQFQHDRVIQSAPLGQTFTGLRPGEYPHSRHAQHGPSGLSQTSHIHHMPATQTNNRLPPIADVFANDRLESRRFPNANNNNSPGHSSHSNAPPPVPSPGFPPSQSHAPPTSARSREFRSAEEAVQGLSGGREDLLPKVVHYGGVQPPTPPSPMPPARHRHQHHHSVSAVPGAQHPGVQQLQQEPSRPDVLARTASMNGRRRGREEYEREGSPPLAYSRPDVKRATFAVRGEDREDERDWRSGMGSAEKREEFLKLCERAWDLFHS